LHRQLRVISHAVPAGWSHEAGTWYVEGKQLQSLTLAQLKQQCQQLGLTVSGSKAQLQERILAALGPHAAQEQAPAAAAAAGDQEDQEQPEAAAGDPSWPGMTIAQLRDECKRMGLPFYGRKAELVSRLQQAAAAQAQEQQAEAAEDEEMFDEG
jgi:hypothetical protein